MSKTTDKKFQNEEDEDEKNAGKGGRKSGKLLFGGHTIDLELRFFIENLSFDPSLLPIVKLKGRKISLTSDLDKDSDIKITIDAAFRSPKKDGYLIHESEEIYNYIYNLQKEIKRGIKNILIEARKKYTDLDTKKTIIFTHNITLNGEKLSVEKKETTV